jgi:pimeloyl-ACP methyl ester carboxylesterase
MVETRRLPLWQNKIETEVEVSGKGPPLVYLHGPWGLRPDREFLARLAGANTVYAPRHPGTTPGNPDGIRELDTIHDLVVLYGELFDRLELERPALVGHSFGGLVAAEIAATVPRRIAKLALIDPVGLWRDDLPVRNWMILPEAERARVLFAAPDSEAAKSFFAVPQEAQERTDTLVDLIWSQACTGKFVWPVPDKGLKKRIHCIAAPTLILWGKADSVIAVPYAQEFASRIAKARIEIVEHAGHLPQIERAEEVARLVSAFING